MAKRNSLAFYSQGLAVLFLIIISASAIFYFTKKYGPEDVPLIQVVELDAGCQTRRKIDGQCYSGQEPGVFAVMIDNHHAARPQSELSRAGLVYETVVESPVTRFLAFFSHGDTSQKIGPIRSARPFYLSWAKEFNVPYLHVGGSQAALDELAKTYSFDLNEFSAGQYFWRDKQRVMPHNVFTSEELLNQFIQQSSWLLKYDYDGWPFKPEAEPAARGQVKEITLDFGSADAGVKWLYDSANNDYTRYQGGVVHLDAQDRMIKAKNIAIMYSTSKVIDSYGRRETQTLGFGQAIVFHDGQAIKGAWRRESVTQRTKFYDEAQNEIRFNPGQTWIEVLPDHYSPAVYN